MTDDERNQEALFRHAILGDVLSRNLRRGQLRPALKQLAQPTYQDDHGRSRRIAYKTLEEWFYKYRHGGLEALKPRPRSDRNRSRVFAEDLQPLILGSPLNHIASSQPCDGCPPIVPVHGECE